VGPPTGGAPGSGVAAHQARSGDAGVRDRGPLTRVTDLVITDFVRHERATLTDGKPHRVPERPQTSDLRPVDRAVTDAVLTAAAEAPTPIAELRRVVHEQPRNAALWDETAGAGLVRHPYARGRLQTWVSGWVFGVGVAVPGILIFGVADDIDRIPGAVWNVIAVLLPITVIAMPFTLLYVYDRLRKRISGYGPDPRTQAGLRLAELAADEKWATTGFYPQALAGAATDPGRWQLKMVPDDLDVKGGPEAAKDIVDDVTSIADDLGLRGGGL
jgi:hypothetical protein